MASNEEIVVSDDENEADGNNNDGRNRSSRTVGPEGEGEADADDELDDTLESGMVKWIKHT